MATDAGWPEVLGTKELQEKVEPTEYLQLQIVCSALDHGWRSGAFRLQIKDAKVLAVGAGGIGCELLKTLVLTGFENIEVVGVEAAAHDDGSLQHCTPVMHRCLPLPVTQWAQVAASLNTVLFVSPRAGAMRHKTAALWPHAAKSQCPACSCGV